LRKRIGNYDTELRVSTYVRRVEHDVLAEEKLFRSHSNRLRDKYARDYGDSWNDTEMTDPTKFGYEEVAIAAYLLALWGNSNADEKIVPISRGSWTLAAATISWYIFSFPGGIPVSALICNGTRYGTDIPILLCTQLTT